MRTFYSPTNHDRDTRFAFVSAWNDEFSLHVLFLFCLCNYSLVTIQVCILLLRFIIHTVIAVFFESFAMQPLEAM